MRGRGWLVVGLFAVVAAGVATVLTLSDSVRERVLPAVGLGTPVRVYFATPDAQYLVPETYFVWRGHDSALDRLELLAGGPRPSSGLAPVLPPGARPLSVRIEDGTALVDFSSELVTRHWGGTGAELMTVYGIINTTAEVPGVERVRILVDGKPVETLAGHVDLTQPLEADRGLVQMPASDPGRASQPAS